MGYKMDFLDFLPKGATITRLIIVGPYPSYDYISKLIKDKGISKDDLFLIIDDAWDVDEFVDNGYNVQRVCAEKESGLVHAKMYYVHYKVKDGTGIRKMLVTGSANASKNGMKNNAETLSFYRTSLFSPKDKEELEKYFKKLINGKNATSLLLKRASSIDGTMLYLPAIYHYEDNENFYSWIRSGLLCYKYDRDGNFGHYEIELKKSLPIGINFKNTAFINGKSKELKKLRFPYLDNVTWSRDGRNQIKKYGVETNYGYWISKKCYDDCEKDIFSKKLSKELSVFVKEKEDNIDTVVATIMNEISKFRNQNKKVQLDECFRGINERSIREGLYRKISLDLQKANNKAFAARYERGFAVNKMPQLDDEEFDEFIDSFFEFCKMKGYYRCQNKFSKRLKQLVVDLGENYDNMSDVELKQWVVSNWREEFYDEDDEETTTMYGDYLKKYYDEDDEY